jgi:hypothetical protein
MRQDGWNALLATLRPDDGKPFFASKPELGCFAEFVERLPDADRIPTLLHAYGRYRALAVDPASSDPFETSCFSILISTILESGVKPNRDEAVEILQKSFHICGHGSDVEPPLTLAEVAFRDQPYSNALFDAVVAYRETLRVSRSSRAANVKRKLSWVLWHDARRMEKRCHTRRIQQAIHSMPGEGPFHWEWLLRNTSAGMSAKPGRDWIKEGRKRIASIGEERFLAMIDAWFTFLAGEADLSAAGSNVLRLLVWYGALVDTKRSLPMLARLAHASWSKKAPVGKVMGALAWLLHTHGVHKLRRRLNGSALTGQASARKQRDYRISISPRKHRCAGKPNKKSASMPAGSAKPRWKLCSRQSERNESRAGTLRHLAFRMRGCSYFSFAFVSRMLYSSHPRSLEFFD